MCWCPCKERPNIFVKHKLNKTNRCSLVEPNKGNLKDDKIECSVVSWNYLFFTMLEILVLPGFNWVMRFLIYGFLLRMNELTQTYVSSIAGRNKFPFNFPLSSQLSIKNLRWWFCTNLSLEIGGKKNKEKEIVVSFFLWKKILINNFI